MKKNWKEYWQENSKYTLEDNEAKHSRIMSVLDKDSKMVFELVWDNNNIVVNLLFEYDGREKNKVDLQFSSLILKWVDYLSLNSIWTKEEFPLSYYKRIFREGKSNRRKFLLAKISIEKIGTLTIDHHKWYNSILEIAIKAFHNDLTYIK